MKARIYIKTYQIINFCPSHLPPPPPLSNLGYTPHPPLILPSLARMVILSACCPTVLKCQRKQSFDICGGISIISQQTVSASCEMQNHRCLNRYSRCGWTAGHCIIIQHKLYLPFLLTKL